MTTTIIKPVHHQRPPCYRYNETKPVHLYPSYYDVVKPAHQRPPCYRYIETKPNVHDQHVHPPCYRYHPDLSYDDLHLLLDEQVMKLYEKSIRSDPCLLKDSVLHLHTDGSSKGNPGPSSYGGLIRDSKGRWLCGYMGKMKGKSHTSLEAEVWGVYKGLCLIKEKKLSNMLITTDCLNVVRLWQGVLDEDCLLRSTTDRAVGVRTTMDAISVMMLEQKCDMIHTRRDGNHCADQLAKLGGRQYEEYIVLEEPPSLLIPYMLADLSRLRH